MASIYLLPAANTPGSSPLSPFLRARAQHVSKLRVFVDQNSGRLCYKYDSASFVFRNDDDDVTFLLVNEVPNATAKIVSHVSTDSANPNAANAKLRVMAAGQPVPDIATYYQSGVAEVKFKMNRPHFGDHEMVHVGLIVSVQRQGQQEGELILCDPQIGNGPP